MDKTTQDEAQINIFALPNQTTILFVLIVVVFLATLILGSLNSPPICIWPLALGVLIIPLRAMLKHPELNLLCYDLSPAGEELVDLDEVITAHSKALNLPRIPILMVSSRDAVPLHTFGSFRHWYVAVDQETAQTMQTQLADPETAPAVHAQLIHELYHFKTGDHWQLGYTGELLRTNFLLMAWAVMLFLGIGLLMLIATHDVVQFDAQSRFAEMELAPELETMLSQMFLSAEQRAEIREKAAQINLGFVITFIFNAIGPFVVVGLVIWKIYWPRLWRVREFYADAGMVHQQGQMAPALSVLTRLPLPILRRHFHNITPPEQHKRRVFASHGFQQIGKSLQRLRDGVGIRQFGKELGRALRLFPGEYHLNSATRIAAVLNPGLVFDDWKGIAVLVGSLVLLLEVLLLAPLTFLMVSDWPMHFITLIPVILVALNYLVPTVARGKPARAGLFKIVGVVGGLRFLFILAIIVLLVLMLVIEPDMLYVTLCVAIANYAGYTGYSAEVCLNDLAGFVVEAAIKNLAQAVAIPTLIIGALILIYFLMRRIFTWYGFPDANRHLIKIVYGCIIVVVLFWGLTVLPFVTDLILRPLEIFNLSSLVFEIAGFLIVVVSGILFVRADRKYAQRCPECGAILPGDFSPGKQCCNMSLHPWLITEYDL